MKPTTFEEFEEFSNQTLRSVALDDPKNWDGMYSILGGMEGFLRAAEELSMVHDSHVRVNAGSLLKELQESLYAEIYDATSMNSDYYGSSHKAVKLSKETDGCDKHTNKRETYRVDDLFRPKIDAIRQVMALTAGIPAQRYEDIWKQAIELSNKKLFVLTVLYIDPNEVSNFDDELEYVASIVRIGNALVSLRSESSDFDTIPFEWQFEIAKQGATR